MVNVIRGQRQPGATSIPCWLHGHTGWKASHVVNRDIVIPIHMTALGGRSSGLQVRAATRSACGCGGRLLCTSSLGGAPLWWSFIMPVYVFLGVCACRAHPQPRAWHSAARATTHAKLVLHACTPSWCFMPSWCFSAARARKAAPASASWHPGTLALERVHVACVCVCVFRVLHKGRPAHTCCVCVRLQVSPLHPKSGAVRETNKDIQMLFAGV